MANQGYTFAMIRIAEGQAPDVDIAFEANYEGAKAAGLKVGVYHDCCIRTPKEALLEANYCLELLNGRPLDYPVAYDIEKKGSFEGGIENTTALAKSYCETIKEAGYTPMIYSTSSHLINDFDWEELKDIKIWVAHYGVEEPNFPNPYDIWQYTNKGCVEGANNDIGNCDLNYSFLEAENLTFSNEELALGLGESLTLTPNITPIGCSDSITWTSLDSSIVSVTKEGKIKAKKIGTTTITITAGSGACASITIHVEKAPKRIYLSTKSKKLKIGETYRLKPILPSNSASNKIVYKSSNKRIAVVSKNGKIRAKRPGTVTITVSTFNKKQITFKLIVK